VVNDIGHLHAGFSVKHRRAARHTYDQILAPAPIHLLAAAGDTVLCEKLRRKIESDQGINVVIPLENDMAPTTAIAAVRATFGHTRFTPEAAASIAAFTSARMHHDMIYKSSCLH
jgi:hypothetical protein